MLLALVAPVVSHATEVKDLSIEFKASDDNKGHRLLELPNSSPPIQTLSLNLSLTIWGPFYFDNLVHMIVANSKVQWVGWRYEIGVKPCRAVEFFYQHHSQHALDHVHPFVDFPVQDWFGVRWNIIGEGRNR